jgi:hypothetical protein
VCAQRGRVAQPFAHPQRCNVNDASCIRRCWCSSDAEHIRGYVGLARGMSGPRGEWGLEGSWLALRGVTCTHQRTRVR